MANSDGVMDSRLTNLPSAFETAFCATAMISPSDNFKRIFSAARLIIIPMSSPGLISGIPRIEMSRISELKISIAPQESFGVPPLGDRFHS
jgi:hypothetical protein